MNEFNFNTEENYLYPGGRKNLDQLFDVDIKTNKDESLRYVPPKGEQTNQVRSHERIPWQTKLAKVVIGFKDGDTVGRVGVAILSNIDNAYRIVVYKSKTNLLATLTIGNELEAPHLHRQNCYWQFYDDAGVYWSLLFERATDESEFISKLNECGIQMLLDAKDTLRPIEESKKIEIPRNVEERSSMSEDTKKVKTKEDNDSICSDEQRKFKSSSTSTQQRARMLARLPKMGGQQLPKISHNNSSSPTPQMVTASEYSDSEPECIDRDSSLTIIGQPVFSSRTSHVRSQYMLPMNSASTIANTASPSSSAVNPMESHVMQMLLVENRTQNTELRINMDKLESKLERVLDKIETIQTGGDQDDELFKLEEKMLELKKENRRLRREHKHNSLSSKSDSNHDNIFRIYGGELKNLDINIDSNNHSDIDGIIGELIDKVNFFQSQLDERDSQLKTVLNSTKEYKEKYIQEKKAHNEVNEKLEQAQHKIRTLQTTLESKKDAETLLTERLGEIKSHHAAQLNNVKHEMTETVKDIMNMLYHNLAENIVSMDKLIPDKVLASIGRTIRQDTLSAVAKISK